MIFCREMYRKCIWFASVKTVFFPIWNEDGFSSKSCILCLSVHEWNVKIGYESFFAQVSGVWLFFWRVKSFFTKETAIESNWYREFSLIQLLISLIIQFNFDFNLYCFLIILLISLNEWLICLFQNTISAITVISIQRRMLLAE